MFAKRTMHWLSTLSFALLAQTALASPTWQLNPEGSGASGAVPITALNVGGVGFVQIIPDSSNPTQFTFLEHGAYQAVQSDGTTPFGTRDLTITYSVSGSGSFLNPGALQ